MARQMPAPSADGSLKVSLPLEPEDELAERERAIECDPGEMLLMPAHHGWLGRKARQGHDNFCASGKRGLAFDFDSALGNVAGTYAKHFGAVAKRCEAFDLNSRHPGFWAVHRCREHLDDIDRLIE